MSVYAKIGAVAVSGAAGYAGYEVAVKVIIAGLYLTGAFYAAQDSKTLGADFLMQYDNIDLSALGFDVSIPIPVDRVDDITIRWWIYDETGDEINTDSYHLDSLEKGVPVFIKKETALKRPVDLVEIVTVKLDVSFRVYGLSLSKQGSFKVDVRRLVDSEIML